MEVRKQLLPRDTPELHPAVVPAAFVGKRNTQTPVQQALASCKPAGCAFVLLTQCRTRTMSSAHSAALLAGQRSSPMACLSNTRYKLVETHTHDHATRCSQCTANQTVPLAATGVQLKPLPQQVCQRCRQCSNVTQHYVIGEGEDVHVTLKHRLAIHKLDTLHVQQ